MDPPSNFRGDIVTLTYPNSVTNMIRKLGDIQWGCWAPFFPKMALACLSYKTPLRFNNLGIGGIFPCYKMPLRFQQLHRQGHTLCYKMLRFWYDKLWWSSSCHATKSLCDFHDGLTWLKQLLYKMRFTSLSYKILDLDFMSRLAWLKWKPL